MDKEQLSQVSEFVAEADLWVSESETLKPIEQYKAEYPLITQFIDGFYYAINEHRGDVEIERA